MVCQAANGRLTMPGERSLVTFRIGKYKVDTANREVLVGDKRIELPWRCFEALLVMIEADGEVVDRDALFRRLWPNVAVEENSLNQAISRLRKELGETGDEGIVETVPRRGYRLTLKPEPLGKVTSGSVKAALPVVQPNWLRWNRWSLILMVCVGAVAIPAGTYEWDRWSKHRKALALVEEGFELVRENRVAGFAEAKLRFSTAVDLDPKLALAYAGLAEAMARSVDGSRSHAKEMVERSLQIDPSCAACQGIAGWILMTYEWQFSDAMRYLQTAARQQPSDTRIQIWHAQALACSGRLDQALQEIDRTLAGRPTEAAAIAMRAGILYLMTRYEESIRDARLVLGINARYTSAYDWIYRAGMASGRAEEAMEAKASLTANFTGLSVDSRDDYEHRLNEAYRAGGIQRLVNILLAGTSTGLALVENRYDRAVLRMKIGDHDGALDELEQVFEFRPFHCIYMGVDPAFAPIRNDPRFRKVLGRIGLDKVLSGTCVRPEPFRTARASGSMPSRPVARYRPACPEGTSHAPRQCTLRSLPVGSPEQTSL